MKIKIIIIYALTTISLFGALGCKKKTTSTPQTPTVTPVVTDPTSVTDVDGNVYPVLRICGKLWMTQNLKTTRYNDSTFITTGLSNTLWTSAITGAYSIYNSLPVNDTIYGKLYNWFAANNLKLAPKGWHVASETEWTELVNCLGGFAVAGGKMKSTSTLWNSPNTGANNSSGFNGLPGGYRGTSGNYNVLGNTGYWWASNQRNATQGEYINLDNAMVQTAQNGATKQFGYSIRCIRD